MTVLGFIVIAVLIGVYVVLDGYDLGVGALHLFVARGDRERALTMESIGPFWNGNEVWLIAAGATLFALFPQVFASAFSGFYLPFTVVLWLLMFRGLAIELRGHFPNDLWHAFFDVTFAAASALLILLFGVALGNILRGVPLGANHYFQGSFAFLLNPYALGVGVFAVLALAQHGAAYLVLRLEGAPAARSLRAVRTLWPLVLIFAVGLTVATFRVRSPLPNVLAMPWVALAPLVGFAGLAAIGVAMLRNPQRGTFTASSVFLAGMLASAAVTVYPYLLPGFPGPRNGLSIFDAAPSPVVTFAVIIAGVALVAGYRTFAARLVPPKVSGPG